jgi:tripartite ATP-independent transporter DctP family solute receptor
MKRRNLVTIFLVTLCSIIILALAGCGNQSSSSSTASDARKNVTLKYAELYNEENPIYKLGVLFSDKVLEKTQGRIKIDLYGNSQLGDEKSSYQALQMGSIDFFRGNSATLADFGVKKINIITIPYIFRNREHLWNVFESDVGNEILRELEELNTNMVGLFYLEEGARSFFTSKPATTFESLKGLKIRVPQTQMLMDTVSAIGANPTPVAYSELYSALSTGTVDGAENPPTAVLSLKFYEPAKNYILDEHTFNPIIVIMAKKSWDKISADEQAIMKAAGKEVAEVCKAQAQQLDEEAIAQLRALGVTVTPVPDKTKFQQATQGLIRKYVSPELENIVQAIAAK